jgi:hypothetical protein
MDDAILSFLESAQDPSLKPGGLDEKIIHLVRSIRSSVDVKVDDLSPLFRFIENANSMTLRNQCLEIFVNSFGEKNPILVDIYTALSKFNFNENETAIEFAGKALLLSINIFGLVHVTTASCHYNLGTLLYSMESKDEDTIKELNLFIEIEKKLSSSSKSSSQKEQVVSAYYTLALLHEKKRDILKVYFYAYQAYIISKENLIPDKKKLKDASELMNKYKTLNQQTLFTRDEILSTMKKLKWNKCGSESLLFHIQVYARHQLQDKDFSIKTSQLRQLFSAGIRSILSTGVLRKEDLSLSGKIENKGTPLTSMEINSYVNDLMRMMTDLPENTEISTTLGSPLGSPNKGVSPSKRKEARVVKKGTLLDIAMNKRTFAEKAKSSAAALQRLQGNQNHAIKLADESSDDDDDLNAHSKINGGKVVSSKKINSTVAIEEMKRSEEVSPEHLEKKKSSNVLPVKNQKVYISTEHEAYLKAEWQRLDKHKIDGIERVQLNVALGSKDKVLAMDNDGKSVLMQFSDSVKSNVSFQNMEISDSTEKENNKKESGESSFKILEPPPVPTSWPPVLVRLTFEDLLSTTANKNKRPASGRKSVNAVLGTSRMSFTSGSGKIITGAFAINKAKERDKLREKKVDYVEIQDTKGTLWEEDGPLPVDADVLFDDFDEEVVKEKTIKAMSILKRNSVKSGENGSSVKSESRKDSTEKKHFVGKKKHALDPHREQNLGIMLSRFGKKPPSDIVTAIMDFDCDKLGASAAATLIQYIPGKEEVTKVNEYLTEMEKEFQKEEGDIPDIRAVIDKKLSRVEQYVYEMGKLQESQQILGAMNLYLSGQETSQNCEKNAEIIGKAIREVEGSARLKFLFRMVLKLINSVNSKTLDEEQDKVKGITMSTMENLSQVSTNSGDSLERYLVHKINQHVPEALELMRDIPSSIEAKRISFNSMRIEYKALKDGVKAIDNLLQTNSSISTEGRERLTKKREELAEFETSVSGAIDEAEHDFAELCKYLGENPEKSNPESIFGTICRFEKRISSHATIIPH